MDDCHPSGKKKLCKSPKSNWTSYFEPMISCRLLLALEMVCDLGRHKVLPPTQSSFQFHLLHEAFLLTNKGNSKPFLNSECMCLNEVLFHVYRICKCLENEDVILSFLSYSFCHAQHRAHSRHSRHLTTC